VKVDRLVEFKLLKAWNDLKKERKQNGFASTRLNIAVKVKESVEKEVCDFYIYFRIKKNLKKKFRMKLLNWKKYTN
jgi:hypothetical protein